MSDFTKGNLTKNRIDTFRENLVAKGYADADELCNMALLGLYCLDGLCSPNGGQTLAESFIITKKSKCIL